MCVQQDSPAVCTAHCSYPTRLLALGTPLRLQLQRNGICIDNAIVSALPWTGGGFAGPATISQGLWTCHPFTAQLPQLAAGESWRLIVSRGHRRHTVALPSPPPPAGRYSWPLISSKTLATASSRNLGKCSPSGFRWDRDRAAFRFDSACRLFFAGGAFWLHIGVAIRTVVHCLSYSRQVFPQGSTPSL